MTIALVATSYAAATQGQVRNQPPNSARDDFRGSFSNDLNRILIAKGYKVAGPYESLNVMTFPEKRGANLTLTPVLELLVESKPTRRTPASEIVIGTEEGFITVTGWLSLEMLEPMSGEKMWIKRVNVEPVQLPYLWRYTLQTTSTGQRVTRTRVDNRQDQVTTALNRIYPRVMEQTWTYFHPDEIATIKRQADEVRERKRY